MADREIHCGICDFALFVGAKSGVINCPCCGYWVEYDGAEVSIPEIKELEPES